MQANTIISSKIIIPAFFQIFLISISRFIIGPIIPLISTELDVGLEVLGWIISLNIFILLIFTIITGNLIELFGLKKILNVGMAIQAAGFFVFYFVTNTYLLIFSNTILGIGGGIVTVCLIVIANTSQNRKTRSFFNLFLGAALALTLAPVITIFIERFDINWRNIFVIFGVAQAFLIINFIFFRYPNAGNSIPNMRKLISSNRIFIRSPLLIMCFIFNFFNASVMETFYTWFTSYFSIFDARVSVGSFILFLFSAAVFIGVYIKKYLIRFTGERKMLIYNISFSIFFLVLFLFANNLILKSIIIFFFGFSLSANYILIISLAFKNMHKGYNSTSGYLQGAEFVGIIIFQSVSGFILENIIKSGLIYMNIILLLILLFIALIINYKFNDKKNKKNGLTNVSTK